MKKFFSMLAVAVMALTTFAGCNNTTTGSDNTEPPTDSNSGVVNLKLWCDGSEQPLVEELVNAFIEEHKNEATITVTYDSIGSADAKDAALADVNNAADLFYIADDQFLTLVASGMLEPIPNSQDIAKLHLEGAVDAASLDGKMYAYPVSADNGYFLYYDKNYFTEEDVKSLDRILAICKSKNKKFVMDWSSGWYLYSFFGNTGMHMGLAEDGLSTECNWNTKEGDITGVDVAQAMLNIASNPAFVSRTDYEVAAKNKTAIAGVSGVWNINAIKEAYGENYGACKLPTYTCAGKQIQMSSFKGYRLLAVNSYSANKEWAAKLAEHLTSESSQNFWFEKAGRGPSNIKAASSDAVNKVPAIAAVIEQSEYAVLQKVGQTYWEPASKFGVAMANRNLGGKTLQAILDSMVESITEE